MKTTPDTYQRITNFVIENLEKGQVLWKKGWNSAGLPKNIVTGHQYQGFNLFILNFITHYQGYKSPWFLTFKQAMDLKGTIRRGEKGYLVVWWATVEDQNKKIEVNGQEEFLTYRVPKCHTVFNIDQTYGIEFPKAVALCRSHSQRIQECEQVIENMPNRPSIKHGGDEAYYVKLNDQVCLPNRERFHSDEAYYETLFHELAHSTGHSKRLNREELMKSDGFGKELYSKEELTAELASAFLCALSGIEQQTLLNSTAYIKGWLSALKNDKRLILKAAAQAQAAVNYIVNKMDPKATCEVGKEDSSFELKIDRLKPAL